jgi:hypothetical protein
MTDQATPTPSQNVLLRIEFLAKTFAEQNRTDTSELLSLLRCLEQVHREICDVHFQSALPTNRQALYTLLKEMEQTGGWPYIPRMHLNRILQSLREINDLPST